MPYNGLNDPNLPDYIKRLSKKLRSAWVKIWNDVFKRTKDEKKAFSIANGVIKKMKAEGAVYEIKGEFGEVKDISGLSEEELKSYGANPSLVSYRPNCKIVEGKLFATDTSFCPTTELETPYYFVLPENVVEENLWQLTNMPVHITPDLSSHSVEENGISKYYSIGTILGAKLEEDQDEKWAKVLLALWEDDYPEEVNAISENKEELGMSVELFLNPDTLEAIDLGVLQVNDLSFKGLALLKKEKAAFPQSQILVANKGDKNSNIKGDTKMDIKISYNNSGTTLVIDDKEIPVSSISFYLNSDGVPSFSFTPLEAIGDISGDYEYGISLSKKIVKKEDVELAPFLLDAEKWTRKYINDLPDSAFAVIEPAYKEGKTDNKNARHLPYKDKNGKVDLSHLRNALARMNQIKPITDSISAEELRKKARDKLIPLAKKYLPNSKWAKGEGGERSMDISKLLELNKDEYTKDEVVAIIEHFKQEQETSKILAEKDEKIKELEQKVAEIEASKKEVEEKIQEKEKEEVEKNAKIEAEKWFEDHKSEYPEENKDEIIDIRTKMELGTATKEEITKLVDLKKADTSLNAARGEDEKKKIEEIDKKFGIKSDRKK